MAELDEQMADLFAPKETEEAPPVLSIDNISFNDLPTVELDGQTVEQYDGDTFKLGEDSLRVPGYDAGEVSRLEPDGTLRVGSRTGEVQTSQINQLMDELNFNTTGPKEKDPYGRDLGEIVNPAGVRLSDYLHAERIVPGSKWADAMNVANRSAGEYIDFVNGKGNNLTPGDKARAMVEQVVGNERSQLKAVFGDKSDVSKGFAAQRTQLEAMINSLSIRAEAEQNPEKKAELESDLLAHQRAKTELVNSVPTALFYLNNDKSYSEKPGAWGELWNSAEKSFYMLENTAAGFSAWAGDVVNSDSMTQWGEDWAADTQEDLRKAGYTTDMWSVRNPFDAARFVGNTIVQYGPQLGIIYGAAKVGAIAGAPIPLIGPALGAAVAATGAAFVMAVSSVYQDQPEGEKDPLTASGIAMAIALVDRFGLSKSMELGRNAFTKEGKEQIIDLLDKKFKGEGTPKSKKELEELYNRETMVVLKEAGVTLKDAAARQLVAKKDFSDLVKRLSQRAGIEGATEAVQEAIQDIGIAGTTSKELNYEELMYRMIESGTIGSIIGGSFAIRGELKARDAINLDLYANTLEDESTRSIFSIAEEARTRNDGKKLTVTDRRNQIQQEINNKGGRYNLEQDTINVPEPRRWREALGLVTNPRRAVQAFRNFAIEKVKKKDGTSNRFMQEFNAMIGTNFRIFGGNTISAEQKGIHSRLFKEIPDEREIERDFKVKPNGLYPLLSMSELQLENLLTQQGLTATEITDRMNRIQLFKDGLEKVGFLVKEEVERRNLQKEISLPLNELQNYFLKANNINPKAIDDNFKRLLLASPGYRGKFFNNPSLARRANKGKTKFKKDEVDAIAFAAERGRLTTEQRERLRRAGVFDNPDFSPYVSKNIRENLDYTLDSIAREITVTDRFGKQGQVASYLLKQAQVAGEITEQERLEFSMMTLDYLAMVRGDYRPIKNKKLAWAQDTALFASTLSYMDTNFFANIGEMTYGLIGLDRKQTFKYIKVAAKTFFLGLGSDVVLLSGNRLKGSSRKSKIEDADIQRLVETGILAPDANDISYLEGVNTQSKEFKKLTVILYKLNLVENQTMAVRAARASMAWNNLSKMVELVRVDRERGFVSPAGRWASDNLNYYGVDVGKILTIMNKLNNPDKQAIDQDIIGPKRDPKMGAQPIGFMEEGDMLGEGQNLSQIMDHNDIEEMRRQYRTGVTNFTDEFSVRPEPGSSPRWLEDSNYALFTQFMRFISHFTANVIPRTWDNYIMKGPPGMSYDVFKTIMGAYLLAMTAQMLKDYMVYGEKAPWLDDDEEDPDWFRTSEWRAAEYTGWMGTPAMAVEAINEMSRRGERMGLLSNTFETVVKQSPVLSTAYSEYTKGLEDIPERIAKKTPFIGAFKASREAEEEILNRLLGEN
jgi:hypothetical protein